MQAVGIILGKIIARDFRLYPVADKD